MKFHNAHIGLSLSPALLHSIDERNSDYKEKLGYFNIFGTQRSLRVHFLLLKKRRRLLP
jgi:hypothetical protein